MEQAGTLTTLFTHHLWANLRLLERCADLTDKQLAAAAVGTYGPIIDTLQHITMSEKHYFSRISTGQRLQVAEDAAPLTMAEMATSLRETGSGLIAWATQVQAGDTVEIDWDGTPVDVPKAVILTQVINHGTEHRDQIKVTLTQLGIEPPNLQGWDYFDDVKG